MSLNTQEINMNSRICNPARHRKSGETCLSSDALENLRETWNKNNPTKQIKADKTRKNKNSAKNRLKLWQQLRNAMKSIYDCDNEFCVVKKIPGVNAATRKNMIKRFFRPEKPEEWKKKKTTWLDSFNLEDVVNQYEDAHPEFEFIGPVPIDFDAPDTSIGNWGKCIVDEMCKMDIKDANKKGTDKIGVIFNLDKHDEPGSHWVCAFVDYPKKSAYYFDSYGLEPPTEIAKFLERCKDQGCDNVLYNDIRHQRKDSECGMYCLYVIICLLKGKDFHTICMDIVKDDTINAFRDVIYSTEKPRKEAFNSAVQKLCT
jgi:hypothetical protein